jgi:hypothetical protein
MSVPGAGGCSLRADHARVVRKRRTDRLTVELAQMASQVSFARAAGLSRQLADTATLLSGTEAPWVRSSQPGGGDA